MDNAHTSTKRQSASQRGYTSRWRRYARGFLKENPLCVICQSHGVVTAAECVDHIEPHKGDMKLFWDSKNHQSTCIKCNSRKAAQSEGRWAPKRYTMPDGLRPSVVPLVIVTGPPGGGKDTYVRNNMGVNDLVINADDICIEMTGKTLVAAGRRWMRRVFERRNEILRSLGDSDSVGKYDRAWLVVSAPTIEVREFLRKALLPESVVVMLASHEECVRRIVNDESRRGHAADSAIGVTEWYLQFGGLTVNDMVVEG